MRILHVTQGYSPAIGGTEWLIQRVSEELVRQFRDEVTVFTTNCFNGEAFNTPRLPRLPVGWEVINGVCVQRFPVYSRLSWCFRILQGLMHRMGYPGNQHMRALSGGPIIPGLTKAIREYPADVIAASSFPLLHMFSAVKGAEATGRPCVLIGGMHPEDGWGFDRPMIYDAIRRATHYIAYTDYEAKYVIARGAAPERVTTIGVGVDLEPFKLISTEEAKRRLGLGGKPVVGFMGQLGGHKGVDTLIKAMPTVWSVFPDAHLLIAGGRTLFVEHLENLIHQLPKNQQDKVLLKVNFANDEKPWFFNAVDVFAYPSGFESFGIAFLEAWACRKPVIGCWRGAIPWVVTAGRDGLLVGFRDQQALAEAAILLLANPHWAQSLGEAGYLKVRECYNWPEIARRFRQVYQEALTVA